jgi:uncharacterized protein (TIGR03437 family)
MVLRLALGLVCLLITASATTPSGTLQLAAGSPFYAGDSPASLVFGDFNSDGKLDAAVVNQMPRSGAVHLLLGNGAGSFTPAGSAPAGDAPWAIASADFNGDGALDLALANFNSDNVSVLLGDGHGAFRPAPGSPFALPQNGRPVCIAAADLNRDGKVDLVVGELFGGVSVLLGNGTGAFAHAAGSPLTAHGPTGIVVGDFNRDGRPDLAFTNAHGAPLPTMPGSFFQSGNSITVVLGDGTGGFTPAPGSPFTVGSLPGAIVTADFNLDGYADLAVLNQDSRDITVLLGNGFGGFTAAPSGRAAAGINAANLVAADLNGDGAADLAIGHSDTSGVMVLLGNGTGGFTPAAGGSFRTGQAAIALAAADLNGDGRIDLAASDLGSGVYVLLGSLSPTAVLLSTTAPALIEPGQTIPLRAQVSATGNAFAAPAGLVTFLDGATVLGTAALSGGAGAISVASLSPGKHTLKASYLGDPRSAPSTSNDLVFTTPGIQISGIANGASFQPGVAAPNTILSLFGTRLRCATGPQVILDGAPAEILAAVDTQVNFVAPPAVVPGAVSLQVACGSERSDPYPLATAVAAPAFFTAAATGAGQASIVNQDGSINGPANPAARGEYISVFLTGLGRYAPPDANGLRWTIDRVSFFFGDVEAPVLFAGAAPGYTLGLQQVNVLVPADAPAGDAVPLRLSSGSAQTRQIVTAAIR